MKLFDLDTADARRSYDRRGWIHVTPGVTTDFLQHLEQAVEQRLGGGWLDGPGLAGAKQQLLYDFPDEVDLDRELFDPIAAMFGLDRTRLTLSERHLKVYDAGADPDPVPHKDRLASTVSLGVTIRAPQGTRAFLHPSHELDVNPFMAPHLLASLPPDRHPSRALAPDGAVEVADAPGDVLAFAGSAFWHGRRQAAGAVLLYLKFNAFGADPLHEDPRTDQQLERSGTLAAAGDGQSRVWLGPDFVALAERAVAPRWERTTVAEVWDRPPLWLSEAERSIVESAVDGPTLGELVDRSGVDAIAAVRRLADGGVLLLTDGPATR